MTGLCFGQLNDGTSTQTGAQESALLKAGGWILRTNRDCIFLWGVGGRAESCVEH